MKSIRRISLVISLAVLASSALASLTWGATTMQAAVYQGDKLTLQTREIPEPGANEVRIKVRAAGVNPVDYSAMGAREGNIPGFDVSGTIDSVGAGVTAFKVGDAVLARGRAAYAQYAVAPVATVSLKPAKLSFEEAAGIPIVGETAYRALVEVASLRAGQRILVHGGAGGVGSAGVQIAKARGAYVIATGSPRNHEFLRAIGASEVIDYNTVKFEAQLENLDVVLNTVDVATGVRSLGVLKPDGILVSVVQQPSAEQCGAAKVRCARPDRGTGPSVAALLDKVGELVAAGQYRVNVDRTFALAQANDAWELAKQKHTRGKLIITMPN